MPSIKLISLENSCKIYHGAFAYASDEFGLGFWSLLIGYFSILTLNVFKSKILTQNLLVSCSVQDKNFSNQFDLFPFHMIDQYQLKPCDQHPLHSVFSQAMPWIYIQIQLCLFQNTANCFPYFGIWLYNLFIQNIFWG